MKAEAVAPSAELLVPDLKQARREGIPAAGAANQGDFLLALLAAMVQQDNNMQGGLQAESQGEAFPGPESILPDQGGPQDGKVLNASAGACWQYLSAIQGSHLCVPLPLQLPAEKGTAPEQGPLAVMDLNESIMKGLYQAQAVPAGEIAGTATAEEQPGMTAEEAPGRQSLNSNPVTAAGNQGQVQPGFPADRVSMALRSLRSEKSPGEEQAAGEPASHVSLTASPSGSERNGWGRQDAIPAELRENGVQLRMTVDRVPAAGDVQYPGGVNDEGLPGASLNVNVIKGQIPVQTDKTDLSMEIEKEGDRENGSGPAAGDISGGEGQLSRELRDIGRNSGGTDSGQRDTRGAAGSVGEKPFRKAVSGDYASELAEIDPSVSVNGRAAVDSGETIHLAGAENRHDPVTTVTTQLSNITPGKFPEVVLPHVAALLRNAAPDHARVTVIRLKLEPENMGEIKIRLSYSKGELTAHFFTSSGLVKDAVECSLPQLRETLAQHNISLAEAGAFVGQDQQGQRGTGFTGFGYGRQGRLNGGFSGEYSGEPINPVNAGNNGGSLDLLI